MSSWLAIDTDSSGLITVGELNSFLRSGEETASSGPHRGSTTASATASASARARVSAKGRRALASYYAEERGSEIGPEIGPEIRPEVAEIGEIASLSGFLGALVRLAVGRCTAPIRDRVALSLFYTANP